MKRPICSRPARVGFDLAGPIRHYADGVIDRWLLSAPLANPAMLQMFRDRDLPPLRDLVPWAGEFAGKYLTAAVQVLRLTGDDRLRAFLREFVPRLIAGQDRDGYLGPWPRAARLKGAVPGREKSCLWDAWGHYHVMLGLLLWHELVRDRDALAAATRIGDLLVRRFLGKRKPHRLVDTGSTEMNLAPAHGLCLLYRRTLAPQHLALAEQLISEFAAVDDAGEPLAGDYLRAALAQVPFCACPRPRWESLHPIMALVEVYWLTGNVDHRTAFERLWWSMLEGDRHNNGGFTSGERATGDPCHSGAIETCCSIAWLAMSVEMLKLTANSVVADELELTTLNSGLGMHAASGRWSTYNTPSDGSRRASAHTIVFQARAGQPELNCCSVNAPRGLGLVSEWALTRSRDALLLNWYGPGRMTTEWRGQTVTLEQQTDYPRGGNIALTVSLDQPSQLTLKLRIPYWSQRTNVRVGGRAVANVLPGQYLVLSRRWGKRTRIEIDLDMSLHCWRGVVDGRAATSIYRGPLLLTFDARFNGHLAGRGIAARNLEWHGGAKPDAPPELPVPALNAKALKPKTVTCDDWLPPLLLLEVKAANGKTVRLCDFASAGQTGTLYRSWLPVRNAPRAADFSCHNPLRSQRLP